MRRRSSKRMTRSCARRAFTREERHQRRRDGHAGPVQRLDREGVEKPGQRQEEVGAGSGSTT